MDQTINALSNSTFFKGKTLADVENALSSINSFIKCYKSGELIFGVTQRTEHIGIIITGSIEVKKGETRGQGLVWSCLTFRTRQFPVPMTPPTLTPFPHLVCLLCIIL